MKCKNLGVVINATDLDLDMVDTLHEIHAQVEDVQSKQKAGRHGK